MEFLPLSRRRSSARNVSSEEKRVFSQANQLYVSSIRQCSTGLITIRSSLTSWLASDNLYTILKFSRRRHLCAKSLGLKRLEITDYQVLAPDGRKQREQCSVGRLIMQSVSTGDKLSLAWVAGVQKGRGRELGRETAREGGGRRVPFLAPLRAQIPPFPSPFNTCHAG